jgi:hypothetical protein
VRGGGKARGSRPGVKVAADGPDVAEHTAAVGQHPDPAAGLGPGPDRDLGDSQAEPPGQQEQLHVEGEPVDPGAAEELLSGLSAEGLEPALGVGEGQVRQQMEGGEGGSSRLR